MRCYKAFNIFKLQTIIKDLLNVMIHVRLHPYIPYPYPHPYFMKHDTINVNNGKNSTAFCGDAAVESFIMI